MTAKEQVRDLLRAHAAGERYANTLKPGVIFLGAGPAAASHYPTGTPEYRMFLGAALDLMDSMRIHTDANHTITRVARRTNEKCRHCHNRLMVFPGYVGCVEPTCAMYAEESAQ